MDHIAHKIEPTLKMEMMSYTMGIARSTKNAYFLAFKLNGPINGPMDRQMDKASIELRVRN